jgi:hypothetical protein
MSYLPSQEEIDDVRIATGNILPDDYPDTQIAKKLQSAFSKIQLGVGRTLDNPYGVTDVEYSHAYQLRISMAAMYCLKAYGPEFIEKVNELKTETDADLVFLQENVQEAADTGGVTLLIATTPYMSFMAAVDEDPYQTTVVPYRSGLTDSV